MEEVKMNWLSDQNGKLLAPKTLIEAVQNAKGTSLEELLNSSGSIPQHKYSTEEKVVGTWIDRKPIYEITIDLGEWTLNSSLNYDATHLNIDEVIFIDAFWHQINQPNYRGTISTTSGIDNRCLYFNGTYIKGASNYFTHRYITIQYTKTTD